MPPDGHISKFAAALEAVLDEAKRTRGWSPTELARRIGVERQVFTNAFNRLRSFGPDLAFAIIDALEMPDDKANDFLRCYIMHDRLEGLWYQGFVEELLGAVELLPPDVSKAALRRAFKRLRVSKDAVTTPRRKKS